MRLVGDRHPVASILFGVAALQVLVGLVGLFLYRVNPDADIPQLGWFLYSFQSGSIAWIDWALAFSGAVYIALGFFARSASVAAAFCGAILYAGLLALQALQNTHSLQSGAVTKILVTVLLMAAIVFALRRPVAPAQSSAASEMPSLTS